MNQLLSKAIFISFIAFSVILRAQEYNSRKYEVTATNGLKLALHVTGTSRKPLVKDGIYYQFFAPSNMARCSILIPSPAYLCKVELRDRTGKEVGKTWAGGRYGKEFEKATLSNISYHKIRGFPMYSDVTPQVASGEFNFPSCNQLFHVKEPGPYTLTIRFQVVRKFPTQDNHAKRELVRFPPIHVKIEKEPDRS